MTIAALRLKNGNTKTRGRRRGLTLLELTVVMAGGLLLLGVVTPALQAARRQSYDTVCLNNLQALGGAIHTYASEYDGRLPGPLHPAIFHGQSVQAYLDRGYSPASAEFYTRRQTVPLLASVLGDAVNDRMASCPVMAGMASDAYFDAWSTATGRIVFPVHYALNNYGSERPDSGGSLNLVVRKTNPPEYFGYNPPLGFPQDGVRSPQPLSRIPRASEEWMGADAWYRSRNVGTHPVLSLFKQEGPYQSDWSGEALPFWAPHGRPARSLPASASARAGLAAQAGSAQQDGWTNTVFIDGHVEAVPSRRLHYQGQTIMYGFPGTVNPDFRALSASYLALINQFRWE